MHMADALISPAVGGTLWAGAAGLIAYSSKKVKQDMDDRRIPLMGVLGAFILRRPNDQLHDSRNRFQRPIWEVV